MKLFSCQGCGQLVYLSDLMTISALDSLEENWRALAAPDRAYKFCRNTQFGVCNWMVPVTDESGYCAACRHNHLIPNLDIAGHDVLWARLEAAKHRLFYTLLRLGLPLENRIDNPQAGLAFDFLADEPVSHASKVMTGHDNGLITMALREADDAVREKVRNQMGEPYRTLLGHFRHESGHYFWDRLVRDDPETLGGFRALFGDERRDYAEALREHYEKGAPPGWQENYVSVYATTHPWEDFAETWAHYLHIVDTLETASDFGIKVRPHAAHGALAAKVDFDPHKAVSMEQLIDAWLPIAFAMNSLNRSMGHPDLYPFVLTPKTIEKLAFVQALTHPALRELRIQPAA